MLAISAYPVVLILSVKLALSMAPLGAPLTNLNHPAPSLTADMITLCTCACSVEPYCRLQAAEERIRRRLVHAQRSLRVILLIWYDLPAAACT